jgi:adenylate cyclase
MKTDYRLIWTMVGGNLGGALMTVAYFRFLHPAVLKHTSFFTLAELAYFVVGFLTLVVLGRIVARRWSRRLRESRGPLPAGGKFESLRRRALLVPTYLALLSFAGWVLATLIWAVAWPLFAGTFTWIGALRQSVGMVFVSGAIVAVYVFLATERIWRERLPQLFPQGDLAAAKAPRLRVKTRLLVLFMLMSLLPVAMLSVATLTRANALMVADIESADLVIRNLIAVQIALAVASLVVSVRLANYVAASVAQPLRDLLASMRQVQQGKFDVLCPVVSNDELGEASEGFNQMVAGLREREEIRETFGKYVSPEVRDEILSGRATLEGGTRDVTILFADLRGFTTWVESNPPADVVSGLNAYFTQMDAAIRANGGLVLQFIGDEIEAVFGAPVACADHADQAVKAAKDMQSRLHAWNAGRRDAGEVELQHGIGIHSGMVVAGNIGSAERMSYSLVGDAVNVASRIQSLNKELGTRVLVSSTTRGKLATTVHMRSIPAVRVKGRVAEVEVFILE